MPEIYYTGDLITPDGSDTSIYGDPCEEGCGKTIESGWVDPDRSLGEVRESRDDVRPDVWSPDDGAQIDWLVDRLTERLGWIDAPDSVNGADGGTFYAAESTGPWDACYTGVSMRLAAHVSGASPEILSAVRLALVARQRPGVTV